jgi:hypothetical protein
MSAQTEMRSTSELLLPSSFRDLEIFVEDWALPTQAERHRRRLSSSMETLRIFYEAMVARMDDVIAYLNQFPVDQQPGDARRLFYLTMSLAEIAMAVELFKQPAVVDGFDPRRFVATEIPHMTPTAAKASAKGPKSEL